MAQTLSVTRRGVLEAVADLVPRSKGVEPVLVAIDGVDGAGKSLFANELAGVLRSRDRPVIGASVDDFHRPRSERYRLGRSSPVGYWLDSYDYVALSENLLAPLGPGGPRRYRTGIHDVETDEPLDRPWATAPPRAALIMDGIFLHRDELLGVWDFSVYLDVPVEISVARMVERDGANPDPNHPSNTRYVEGQRLYLDACRPWERADVVIDNADWRAPILIGRP
ncbi:MAG: uridine kinase [Acidimicrobiales bacterium]